MMSPTPEFARSEQNNQSSTVAPFTPSSALDVDQDRTLEYLERATPVRLIGTFNNLVSAYADEPVTVATEKARPYGFDYLPVRERQSGAIVGLLITRTATPGTASWVSAVMEPLSGRNLIAADTPLLHFVYDGDSGPCRLILDGAHITGLVTLSDIQKLPVRTALFGLFIHLEILLTEFLRRNLNSVDPFTLLSVGRAERARLKWQGFKEGNMDQDRFSALDFCDKRTLLKRHTIVGMRLKQIDDELSEIETKLKNLIAHGADYALSQDAATRTAYRARLIRDWIVRLRRELGPDR